MIKSIKLKNVGVYKDSQFNFTEGINAITGKNRVGKTTILEGISYSYFAKTKNSTLNKFINYDAKSATVTLEDTANKIKRTRTANISKLEDITKQELDTALNISYSEFLRIFYISSHESAMLFDASYFKNFLIGLFNLEKYSKIHHKLVNELDVLQRVDTQIKKVNKELFTARFKRVSDVVTKYKTEKEELEKEIYKYTKIRSELNQKQGILSAKKQEYTKKLQRLKWDKCFTCDRPIDSAYKEELTARLHEIKPKLVEFENKLKEKFLVLSKVTNKLETKRGILDNKISKGRTLLYVIKDKLKQEETKPNTKRIKELQKLIPIFSVNGFPAHLLQIYTPVIQETANNLLRLIFPDMSIKIRTHKPTSNIPDFKILILKNGEEAGTLDDVSGSESVLINICLRLGIIVIFKQLQATCVDFFICDEGLEKLDNIIGLKVIKLFNNFIKMGYIKQVFLVSHLEYLKKLEDINYIKLGE